MDTPTKDLVPYRYQDEVFRRAQKENIIAALHTGAGKTLISILLIKWISAQETSQGKIIVFLAPKVTLVEQQRKNIKELTSLNVVKLSGAVMDMNDRKGWKKKLESADIFVMTPQIFLNLLTHGHWSISRVSLLIFDECHHARKNDPYTGILNEYRHVAPNERPKIFGMTASPIWNIKDAAGSIKALEANLNSKVVGVRENVFELLEKAPKPDELIVEYPYPPELFDCPLVAFYNALTVIEDSVWHALGIAFSTLEIRYNATLGNVGPYCASLYLFLELQRLINTIRSENKSIFSDDMFEDDVDMTPETSNVKVVPDLLLEILDEFRSFFTEDANSHKIPISIPFDWCTPKVKTLTDILLDYSGKSSTFQCIVFVEQRQVASSLSKVLAAIPELQSKIKTAFLVGQGTDSQGVSKQTDRFHGDAVKLFREGEVNTLIATSVAEEGLDFKKCDLVIRFDDLHHMVSYVQSRGRARKETSTFILMVQKDHKAQLQKYLDLKEKESDVTEIYRNLHADIEEVEEDDTGTDGYFWDLVDRERHVVKSTGAVLTYDNAVQLLGYLCSLIPRDAFTPAPKPKYTGDFQKTLELPRSLPLGVEDLVFVGPVKNSKKEAQRAVAFMAVVRLRELNVFDEYLHPITPEVDESNDVMPGIISSSEVKETPTILNVNVKDPWQMGDKMWIHPLLVEGRVVAGLVTGIQLFHVKVMDFKHRRIRIMQGKLLDSDNEERRLMEEFTKAAIAISNTAVAIVDQLSLLLVPMTQDDLPDYGEMQALLDSPRGRKDWDGISESDSGKLLVCLSVHFNSFKTFEKIRHDLTPLSTPLSGSHEATSGYSTYHDYWKKKWSKKNRIAFVPEDGPLIEVVKRDRSDMGEYSLGLTRAVNSETSCERRMLPLSECVWMPFSYELQQAYEVLPVICRRVTDVYRAKEALSHLQLPPIPTNLVIEATTLPSAHLSFNNQRLETLGDAVLQVCTTVHLMNLYPMKHEGQLTSIRSAVVKNNHLTRKALEVGLESFLTCETSSVYRWRYVLNPLSTESVNADGRPTRTVKREYPRKSLPDCMEALLGAAYVTGGIEMALRAGTSLGMEFGGPLPWFMRYPQPSPPSGELAPHFSGLDSHLGYKFKHNHLILEALTHPSFASSLTTTTYQRLEFLGDAILDLVVVKYLYRKFPEADSHQLSYARQKVICAQTLASIAVRRLGLHKLLLYNSVELSLAVERYVTIFQRLTTEEVVKTGWKYDPPKALSDVFESVVGAVLVDSNYDYEKTAAVVEYIMSDALEVLSPNMQKDPFSQLLEWAASLGCTKVTNEKRMKRMEPSGEEKEGVAILVHGKVISGPVVHPNSQIAKLHAAERALSILRDDQADLALRRICTCRSKVQLPSNLSLSAAMDTLTVAHSVDAHLGTPSASDGDSNGDRRDAEEVVGMLTED